MVVKKKDKREAETELVGNDQTNEKVRKETASFANKKIYQEVQN